MRARPVRPNIYLPVVRFGVADSDWFSVLLISCAGYLIPVPFGVTILYVPLQMWTWLFATAGSIGFFNYIRIGKRPHWLQYKLKSLFLHHRQYRALPNGKKREFQRHWLIETEPDKKIGFQRSRLQPTTPQTALLMAHHNRLQEVSDKKWNESLLTTN